MAKTKELIYMAGLGLATIGLSEISGISAKVAAREYDEHVASVRKSDWAKASDIKKNLNYLEENTELIRGNYRLGADIFAFLGGVALAAYTLRTQSELEEKVRETLKRAR